MAPKLKAHVHAVPDEEGVLHSFGPDDDVPAWAQALITNPNAWADPPADLGAVDAGAGSSGSAAPGAPEPPPRGGAGSGRDAWAAFAASHRFEVPEDASRDDIIASLEEAGIVAPEE